MNKFIKNIFINIFIFLLLIAIFKCFSSPYWGNSNIESKINWYKKHFIKEDANVIVFGSSKLALGFSPITFDDATNHFTKSVNMAAPSVRFIENHYIVEHFIDNDLLKEGSYILYLCDMPTSPMPYTYHSNRLKYYWDFNRTVLSLKYWQTSSATTDRKIKLFYSHFMMAITNLFSIGQVSEIFNNIFNDSEEEVIQYYGHTPYSGPKKGFTLSDYKKNKKRLYNATKRWGRKKNTEAENMLIEECTTFIEKAKNKGINIIFIRLPDVYFPKTDKSFPLIDLGSFNENPEYYKHENLYDQSHLNERGAKIFSSKLGKLFLDYQSRANDD